MVNKSFEGYKIAREIKRSGSEYSFKRSGVNKFKEPTADEIVVGSINCLYHEQNSNIQIVTGETTQTRTKKIPMLLCLYSDIQNIGLKVGDITYINGKKFNVTGVVNVQEWGIVGDISLEVVDDGIQD